MNGEREINSVKAVDKKLSLKIRAANIALGIAVFVACPGDDILSMAGAVNHTRVEMQYSPTEVLRIVWVDKKLKENHKPLLPVQTIDK